MLEVEEDPSSQFVDFTNATALEQFVSDAEQALIAWHLAGKGHASAESLEATYGPQTAGLNTVTTHYTRVLEMELPQRRSDGATTGSTIKYALTLFVSRGNASNTRPETQAAAGNTTKQWQQGREHFTPTMLAIADASHDLAWHPQALTASGSENLGADAVARLAERWFGVDEFLLVTRTSLPSEREKKLLQQQQQQRRASRNAVAGDDASEADDAVSSRAFDGTMDANEANLLLSAIHLALLNCNCTLPGFVPVEGVTRGTWLGTAVPGATGNVSITFETDSIPEVNSNQTQTSISGLLDFFQLKLQLPPHIEDKCRLASGGEAADLSIGTWVSAAFRYAWIKDEDPREAEKQAFEWRYANVVKTSEGAGALERKSLSQVLFGPSTSRDHFWGTATNPVAAVELTAMWPNLREGTYVDNAVHSTLDPNKAPEWMVDVRFDTKLSDWKRDMMDLSRKPAMPLSRVVANLVQAYSKARDIGRNVLVSELAPTVNSPPPSAPLSSVSSVSSMATTAATSSSSAIEAPVSRLPESIPAARAAVVLGNAIGSLTSSIVSAATWKGTDVEEIRRAVAELFEIGAGGDAASSLSSSRSSISWSVPSSVVHTTPVGELVSVLACRMGQLHGVNAMSLLWVEFVKSLRERWFQQRLLPLMSTRDAGSDGEKYEGVTLDAMFLLDSIPVDLPSPDFRNCLLHQKLQLLNTCILRQAERKKSTSGVPAPSNSAIGTRMSDLTAFELEEETDDKDSSHSDDEFFDSVEVQESGMASNSARQPQGVRRAIAGVSCLLTDEPMMEPITQVAVPLTEDAARQQQDLLSRLGVGSESTMLRQQIQSAALVSDMQAFKAANPGACLADFIRWYSPKDWISSDPLSGSTMFKSLAADGKDVWWFEGKGMLSERMRSVAGSQVQPPTSSLHLWHRMWESSVPLPVSKQRCLFDPAEESEKLFHYLETISPHEMFHQMLVGAISSCYAMLERSCLPHEASSQQHQLPTVENALQELRKQCDRAVALLDDACVESQLAFPAGRDQKEEQERAKSQLHLAFDMALDACRTMARGFEEVEMMLSQASALLRYFTGEGSSGAKLSAGVVELVDLLLAVTYYRVPRDQIAMTQQTISKLLSSETLRSRISSLVLHNPSSRDPVHREYVIRCICPRPYLDDSPFHGAEPDDSEEEDEDSQKQRGDDQDESAMLDLLEESPVVVNRMYASFTNQTVRFALTLAESEF